MGPRYVYSHASSVIRSYVFEKRTDLNLASLPSVGCFRQQLSVCWPCLYVSQERSARNRDSLRRVRYSAVELTPATRFVRSSGGVWAALGRFLGGSWVAS